MTSTTVTGNTNAPAQTIWAILTNASQLTPNFGITRINGIIGANAQTKLWSQLDPNRGFALKVTAFVPDKTMVWSGGFPLRLCRGQRHLPGSSHGQSRIFGHTPTNLPIH